MITKEDLLTAIAECQGERNPNANTCVKLAAYYTILDQMKEEEIPGGYSTRNGAVIEYESGTDFSLAVTGKAPDAVMAVMDEVMDALALVNPRLYDCAMRKFQELH